MLFLPYMCVTRPRSPLDAMSFGEELSRAARTGLVFSSDLQLVRLGLVDALIVYFLEVRCTRFGGGSR